jgi:hypothetical protein
MIDDDGTDDGAAGQLFWGGDKSVWRIGGTDTESVPAGGGLLAIRHVRANQRATATKMLRSDTCMSE